ncbi:MAG: hypothetical protein AAGF07_00405 [Patescibacteria group bacterium]
MSNNPSPIKYLNDIIFLTVFAILICLLLLGVLFLNGITPNDVWTVKDYKAKINELESKNTSLESEINNLGDACLSNSGANCRKISSGEVERFLIEYAVKYYRNDNNIPVIWMTKNGETFRGNYQIIEETGMSFNIESEGVKVTIHRYSAEPDYIIMSMTRVEKSEEVSAETEQE